MTKQSLLGLVIVLLVGTGLTACGGESSTTTAAPSPGSAEAVAKMGGQQQYDKLQTLYQQAVKAGEKKVVIYGPEAATLTPELQKTWQTYFPDLTLEGVQQFGPTLQERIRAEHATGKGIADVVESGSSDYVKAAAGTFGELQTFTGREIDDKWRGPHGVVAVGLIPFAFVYNPNKVKVDELPTTWDDLTDSRWQGRLAISDPSSGVMLTTFTAMLHQKIWTAANLNALAATNPQIVPPTNFNGALTSVAQGQRDGAYWISIPKAIEAIDKGAPVKYLFPMKDDNVVAGIYAGVLASAPHPTAAQLYANWRLTTSAADAAAVKGFYSLVKDAVPAQGLPAVQPEEFMPPVPFDQLPAAYEVSNVAIAGAFPK